MPRFDRLRRYIAIFERPKFSYGTWTGGRGELPWFNYSPEVVEFLEVLDADGWVEKFNWTRWQPRAESLTNDPRALARARTATLRKLLTTHVRKDRFSEGHLAEMLNEGKILAILRRLAQLDDNAPV